MSKAAASIETIPRSLKYSRLIDFPRVSFRRRSRVMLGAASVRYPSICLADETVRPVACVNRMVAKNFCRGD